MDEQDLPKRKRIRLPEFDYSENRMYFITICTYEKKHTLGRIVGYGACDVPQQRFSQRGKIVEKYIRLMDNKYNNVFIDKYVIMPNHIHMIIAVSNDPAESYDDNNRVGFFGTSQAPYPTSPGIKKVTLKGNAERANGIIPKFVSLFKRYCNHEIGENIWQRRFYDHVIRDENDYRSIWEYIDNNPARWAEDEYYTE